MYVQNIWWMRKLLKYLEVVQLDILPHFPGNFSSRSFVDFKKLPQLWRYRNRFRKPLFFLIRANSCCWWRCFGCWWRCFGCCHQWPASSKYPVAHCCCFAAISLSFSAYKYHANSLYSKTLEPGKTTGKGFVSTIYSPLVVKILSWKDIFLFFFFLPISELKRLSYPQTIQAGLL